MNTAVRWLWLGTLFALLAPTTARAQPKQGPSIIYLDQAWSEEDRDWYYHFSQGSAAVSYDIFLNLEVSGGQELFRSAGNSERYGFIVQPPGKYNPDGLPVGISKTTVTKQIGSWPAGEYAGMNCAACHESQLSYKGKRVRIHGGNARVDVQGYVQALAAALRSTSTETARFDRLAARLGATSREAKNKLRERLDHDAANVHDYATSTASTYQPWGPARMDALSMISNRLVAGLTGIRENITTPIAPVKPPFLWNAPQGSWTQWSAVAQNPLVRNLVETMGVYMPIDLRAPSPENGLFASSAALPELARVERQLRRLAPPSWPEQVFGKIDRDKAKAGKALFADYCSSCHNAWPYRWTEPNKFGKRFIQVGLVPQSYVGTDHTQADAGRQFATTGRLADILPPGFRGKPTVPMEVFRSTLQRGILMTAVASTKLSPAELLDLNGYRDPEPPPVPDRVYKAGPREGVWATPPFLHNASVPNLYELLIPASQRTKRFCIGNEFDPVKVGLDTTCGDGRFVFDTSLLGNSNDGHSFQDGPRGNGVVGPLLTEAQRWALVEYLKSIPEQPGRVTPFGGPPGTP